MLCKPGVYKITNILNNNYYYGSSINMSARWSNHKKNAKSGCKGLPKLYPAMRKYGIDNFKIKAILICEKNELEHYEQQFLDKFVGLKECYNVSKDATTPMRNISEETRKKLSKSILQKNMINNEQIIKIRKIYSGTNITIKELAKKYKRSFGIIRNIVSGITYKYLPILDNINKPIISSWNKGLTKNNNEKWSGVCESISKSKKGKQLGKRIQWVQYKCKNPECNTIIERQPSQTEYKKYCCVECRKNHKNNIKKEQQNDFIISNCRDCDNKIKTYRQKCGKRIPRKLCDNCRKSMRKKYAKIASDAELKKQKTNKKYRQWKLNHMKKMSDVYIISKLSIN